MLEWCLVNDVVNTRGKHAFKIVGAGWTARDITVDRAFFVESGVDGWWFWSGGHTQTWLSGMVVQRSGAMLGKEKRNGGDEGWVGSWHCYGTSERRRCVLEMVTVAERWM